MFISYEHYFIFILFLLGDSQASEFYILMFRNFGTYNSDDW